MEGDGESSDLTPLALYEMIQNSLDHFVLILHKSYSVQCEHPSVGHSSSTRVHRTVIRHDVEPNISRLPIITKGTFAGVHNGYTRRSSTALLSSHGNGGSRDGRGLDGPPATPDGSGGRRLDPPLMLTLGLELPLAASGCSAAANASVR